MTRQSLAKEVPMRAIRLIALSVASVLALSVSAAFAQYPAPAGSVGISLSTANPQVGSTVDATVRIIGPGGSTLGGASCSASVSGGTGASVSPAEFTTGPDGSAALSVNTGSSAGQITVTVNCNVGGTNVVITTGGDGGGGALVQLESSVRNFWRGAFGWLQRAA
jgi:hypothetical protein